jgi:hypothetical protein
MVELRSDQVIEFENYLKSLPSDNRTLVKNIFQYDVDGLMDLNYKEFNSLLQNSMSVKQLGQLSLDEINYRGNLVDEIFKLWCYAKVTLITNGNGNGKCTSVCRQKYLICRQIYAQPMELSTNL